MKARLVFLVLPFDGLENEGYIFKYMQILWLVNSSMLYKVKNGEQRHVHHLTCESSATLGNLKVPISRNTDVETNFNSSRWERA